jgi:hypothetical protein
MEPIADTEKENKMKVFDIETTFNRGQTHSVVADDIGKAERLFLAKYPQTTISRIILHSEYVQVQRKGKRDDKRIAD